MRLNEQHWAYSHWGLKCFKHEKSFSRIWGPSGRMPLGRASMDGKSARTMVASVRAPQRTKTHSRDQFMTFHFANMAAFQLLGLAAILFTFAFWRLGRGRALFERTF